MKQGIAYEVTFTDSEGFTNKWVSPNYADAIKRVSDVLFDNELEERKMEVTIKEVDAAPLFKIDEKDCFTILFLMDKFNVAEVTYHKLVEKQNPYLAFNGYHLSRNKRAIMGVGLREEIFGKGKEMEDFFNKWNEKALKSLWYVDYEELLADVEALKQKYTHTERVGTSLDFSTPEIIEFSKGRVL